jgi:hypothetical protein
MTSSVLYEFSLKLKAQVDRLEEIVQDLKHQLDTHQEVCSELADWLGQTEEKNYVITDKSEQCIPRMEPLRRAHREYF